MKSETPYLDELKKTLNVSKMMKELLEKRIELSNNRLEKLDEWDKNELQINLIKTKGELDGIINMINEKEKYFQKYSLQYQKDVDDMNRNFDVIYKKATKTKHKNTAVKHILDNYPDILTLNQEVKVILYKRLKQEV